MKILRERTAIHMVLVFSLPLATALITSQESSAAAIQKKTTVKTSVLKQAGRVSETTNTILSGKGAPSASLGLVGDFYIDIATMNFYGPKSATKWPTPFSLKGPAGPAGTSGVDGKSGTSSAGLKGDTGATGPAGPKGERGEPGLIGATGPVGAQGVQGSAGTPGSAGATGAQGIQGAQGPIGLTGAQGVKGDTGDVGATGATGLQGPIGLTGATGPAGATGATGSQGPAGISTASFGLITFAELKSGFGSTATSAEFGTFKKGSKYLVNVQVFGTLANGDAATFRTLSFTAATESITLTPGYIFTSSVSSRSGSAVNESGVIAQFLVDATSVNADFSLQVRLVVDVATTANALVLAGNFTSQAVGSIV